MHSSLPKYSTPRRPPPARGATRRRQRGAAVLLMIITLIVILTIVLAPRLTLWQVRNAGSDRGYQTLMQAKAAILAHAANPGADPPGGTRRLGQISLTPDLPATAGTTYTGLAGLTPGPLPVPGCATRTWLPGQALSDPNMALVALDVRCFGRFPWLSYGLAGPSTTDDEGGAVPWMFISANLVVGAACFPNLNPLMLSIGFAAPGGCGKPVPFPWLRVVDDRGNLLSSEVAIVLILPGPPVNAAQQRTPPNDRSPAAYLDGLTVAAGCTAPCVAGTYNNAAYTVANGLAWTFVNAPPSTALGPQPTYYQQPFAFNDRLIYVTASEYLEAMETSARLAALKTLAQFKLSHGFLPYSGDNPSPLTPLTKSCALTSRFGLLPVCSGPVNYAVNYPLWFTSSGWDNYFIYAVEAGCVASSPGCVPTLKLGGAATPSYNAVLFSPGRAIQNAPFAVSKGLAQTPIVGVGFGRLADFLDSNTNIGGPPFDASGTAPTANYNDRMYGIP